MNIVSIPLEEIREDFFFRFNAGGEMDSLKRSVAESGIRTPLHVLKNEGGHRLLSGFGRLEAAKALGLKSIPASVCPESSNVKELFKEILLEHLTCRTLGLVEKAHILRILDGIGSSWESVKDRFLPVIDVPANPEIVEELKGVLRFSPSAQRYIGIYNLSLRQTRMFRELSSAQQDCVVALALKLQIRSVELSEIVTMAREISLRDEIPIEEVFTHPEIVGTLENGEFARNEKLLRLKEHLRKKRHPRLSAWNDALETAKQNMGLPSNVALSWDCSLERPGIELQARITTVEEFRGIASLLAKEENVHQIEAMLNVV
ncbi:MAG: ParB N-terminal domain-containing protein [bacterium]